MYTPSRALPGAPDLASHERRSLYYFRAQVAHEMGAPFGSELWSDCMYRLADQHGFLMSALAALSSMHESYMPRVANRERLQSEAMRQYSRAIKHISQSDQADLSLEALLVTIVVFFAFESVRGYFQRALQHVQAGLNIIGERLDLSDDATHIRRAICDAFLALQNQAREWGTTTVPSPFKPENGYQPSLAHKFSSWDEAHMHFEIIYNDGYTLWDYALTLQEQGGPQQKEVFMEKIKPLHTAYVTRFVNWKIGIERLEAISDPMTPARLLLKVYEGIFTALYSCFPTSTALDVYDPDVESALRFAELFLDAEKRTLRGRTPFSLASRIIPVLFLVAWRSNYMPAKNRALELLRVADRREGIWDTKVAFQIAQEMAVLRERLTDVDGEVKAEVGFSEIVFDSETTCKVTYVAVSKDNPDVLGQFLPLEGASGEWRRVERIEVTPTY